MKDVHNSKVHFLLTLQWAFKAKWWQSLKTCSIKDVIKLGVIKLGDFTIEISIRFMRLKTIPT